LAAKVYTFDLSGDIWKIWLNSGLNLDGQVLLEIK
jgi:hypothetical protein